MYRITLLLLVAVAAVALAEGQYYVPRAYYTIDAEGHETAPIPLRRLRRSFNPFPPGGSANANANANAWGAGGGEAHANANANAVARGWGTPGAYGASNPALGAGDTRRQAGPIYGGRSVTATSSVGLDSSGSGYYDQYTSVSN